MFVCYYEFMLIKTRYESATGTKGSAIRLVWKADGYDHTKKIDYPQGAADPHEAAIRKHFPEFETVKMTGEYGKRGYSFECA